MSVVVVAACALAGSGATGAVPSSGVIVFTGTASRQIYTVSPAGRGLKQLTSSSKFASAESPALSPDGRKIAFVANFLGQPTEAQPSARGLQQLWMMNADGSNAHVLPMSAAPVSVGDPTWSPNGKMIAFDGQMSDSDPFLLFVVSADGTDLHPVSEQFAANPSWSPNGKLIAFDGPGELTGPGPTPPSAIYVVQPSGAGLRRLTAADEGNEGYPIWSTDGKSLVYARRLGSSQSLFTVHADGSGTRQLTNGSSLDYPGGFSPDSKQIVFSRQRHPGDPSYLLYIVDSDGAHLHKLQTLGGITPSWGK